MTLIIGLRAKDGVVIGADQKILRGLEVEYTQKYYVYDDSIVLVAVGLTGIVDDFYDLLKSEIIGKRGVETLYEFKIVAEDILAELTRRYSERVDEPRPASVILAGLENIIIGKARMYYIYGEGYGEYSKFVCTGHGGPYALSLAKYLLDPQKTTEENGKRIAYIISWIAEEIDTSVGGIPDIIIIKDREKHEENTPIIEYMDKEEIKQIMEKVKEHKRNLPKILEFEI